MKKNTLALILSIASQFGIAQAIKPFNFIPKDLGTDQDIGILTKVASNQKNIIFLGRGPIAKRPLNKYSHPILIRTDFEGNKLDSKVLLDSMISEAPYFNEPILYINDSIIVFTYNLNDTWIN